MKRAILLAWLALTSAVLADTPTDAFTVDYRTKGAQFGLNTKRMTTPTWVFTMTQGGAAWTATGWTCKLRYWKSSASEGLVTLTGTVSGSTVTFAASSNDLSTVMAGGYAAITVASNAYLITFAEGTIDIGPSPEISAPGVVNPTRAIVGTEYGPFTGDFSGWPFWRLYAGAGTTGYVASAAGATAGTFLSVDGTWKAPSGGGDVVAAGDFSQFTGLGGTNGQVWVSLGTGLGAWTNQTGSGGSGDYAAQAGHATNADLAASATYSTQAGSATNAVNAEFATEAEWSEWAGNATNALTAGYASEAGHATNADVAVSAGSATTATTASNANNFDGHNISDFMGYDAHSPDSSINIITVVAAHTPTHAHFSLMPGVSNGILAVAQTYTNGLVTAAVTGGLYSASNPAGYVTASITNGLVTAAVTGGLYQASNPSGYVTASITNGLVTAAVTGGLYQASNPDGYVTASVTNGLVTAAVTGGLYQASNPAGYITGISGKTMTSYESFVLYPTNTLVWSTVFSGPHDEALTLTKVYAWAAASTVVCHVVECTSNTTWGAWGTNATVTATTAGAYAASIGDATVAAGNKLGVQLGAYDPACSNVMVNVKYTWSLP